MKIKPRIYSVAFGDETPYEPLSGIYWAEEDGDGDTVIHGPYRSRMEAEESIDRWMSRRFDCGGEV